MSVSQKEVAILRRLMQEGRIPTSAWPKGVASLLDQLIRSGIVDLEKPKGLRSVYIVLKNREAVESRISSLTYQDEVSTESVRAMNILKSGASKQGARLPYLTLLLVGGSAVGWESEDGTPVAWPKPAHPSCLRVLNIDERAPDNLLQPLGDVILVENKDLAINISEILPEALKGALVIHYEGWLSERFLQVLKRWRYAKLWIIPDLDPVGFANIKKLANYIPDAGVLIPEVLDSHFQVFQNTSIWKDNFSLVESLTPWVDQQDVALKSIFKRMHLAGAGLEQEMLMILGNKLKWFLIETR
ncbi:hypothetical protein [Pseudomonas putida]|uniref:Wadjet protein JetD C-terminal domain-containing protein n=1 Tax=Pseudomonas putida TaxID=303 RepID=A0A8I1ECL6_PSEPU|nr:hypothetical protein [Pseudomonas putida]MBI6882808.1 hypothetical protein [Pseudomonas putida]